ncbi:hypothetical protein I4U23_007888 [Adineta vaga]|nr:hypothetical protein I4U23_007888 [Adineta vaga]
MPGLLLKNFDVEIKYTQIFINNEWHKASNGKTFPVINPSTGEEICLVEEGTKNDIDKAVEAAQKAFQRNSSWRKLQPMARANLIQTLNGGKVLKESHCEILGGAACLDYYAGWSDKITGETLPSEANTFTYTRHEPIGICGQIIPWLAFHQALLISDGPNCGHAIAAHEKINKIAFTGSVEVGKTIQEIAGKTNLKRVSLELGGKSSLIICEDADLDLAVTTAQISDVQFERVLEYIRSGKKAGAKLECGGESVGDKGYFIQPTIFSNVKDDMKIAREEIFGPVMSIFKFDSYDEVIKRANDTTYGLAAGVMTKDLARALQFVEQLEAGSVWVNQYRAIQFQAPFGDFKQSGVGRKLGRYGLEEYFEVKTVSIKID